MLQGRMKRMKTVQILLIGILSFSMVFPSVLGSNFFNQDTNGESYLLSNLSYRFDFTEPIMTTIEQNNDSFDTISLGDLPVRQATGMYSLPVKPVRLLLPPGVLIDEITVHTSDKKLIYTNINLIVGASLRHIGQNSLSENTPLSQSTSTDELYEYIGTYIVRGYPVAYINLHPVSYDSVDRSLYYYEWMQIQLHTKQVNSRGTIRNTLSDIDHISSNIDNTEMLLEYERLHSTVAASTMNNVDYIIITNEALKNTGFEDDLQYLTHVKNLRGITTDIVTVESIIGNEAYHVNGTWGDNNPENPFYQQPITTNYSRFDDTAARIRNFIRYAYMELGTEYVLLAGDADVDNPEENIIPARGLFANESGLPLISSQGGITEEQADIPSDVYYACLDGNFNSDFDMHFGESADRNHVTMQDEADLLAEVYVGRAPVDSELEIAYFVGKTVNYELQEDNPYLSKILFSGEYLGFPGVSQFGGNYKDLVVPLVPEGYHIDYLYDRDWPMYDPDVPWNGGWKTIDIMNILNTATPHLINHDGHSYYAYNMRMSSNNILSLENIHPFFLYSHGCMAGGFDNPLGYDCIAEAMTVETPYGAFAAIMNARYGLGSENNLNSPSLALDISFYKALFTENIRELGKANHYSKEDHIWQINENGIRWVYYETNLFGDPELSIRDPSSQSIELELNVVKPNQGFLYFFERGLPLLFPQTSIIVGGMTAEVDVSSQPEGYISRVHFFLEGESYVYDTDPPFEWELPRSLRGRYTLKIVAYATDGQTVSETVPLFIWN